MKYLNAYSEYTLFRAKLIALFMELFERSPKPTAFEVGEEIDKLRPNSLPIET